MCNAQPGFAPEVENWTATLLDQGWCVIPGLLSPETIQDLDSDLAADFAETPFCEGGFYGSRTKRFGRLLTRSPRARKIVEHPLVLGISRKVLGPWCDIIQLNLTQGIALHPGARPQLPHRDQDMWRGADGSQEYLVNVLWPLTPFTKENGATRIFPKSHGALGMAKTDLGEPIFAECEPGSAICFLGSTAHGAGSNLSKEVRRGVLVSYSLGWLKPYENLWLAYPPDVARHFPPELAALAGYAQHRPNLGNYEGQCPSILLEDERPAHIGAIDALRPDQADAVAEFAAAERVSQ